MGVRLNTSSHRLKVWEEDEAPKYAIVSHTWVHGGEVDMQQMEDLMKRLLRSRRLRQTSGYKKIVAMCQKAWEYGYDHVWIDTCCINKHDSVEFSEAINSMFRWYQKADVCYVLLSDLEGLSATTYSLRNCRWFTRGWCLQELIAPTVVWFYNKHWRFVGSKDELGTHLSQTTNIDLSVLRKRASLEEVPIAKKMSWAANRKTKKVEDMAYFLFGIFGVHMPLIYGEEENAFYRLQEEIMKKSNDISIFLPASGFSTTSWDDKNPFCHLLASGPGDFKHCGRLGQLIATMSASPFTMTNGGVHFPAARLSIVPGSEFFYITFECAGGNVLRLYLRKVGPSTFICRHPPRALAPHTPLICDPQDVYIISRVTPSAKSLATEASQYFVQFFTVQKHGRPHIWNNRPIFQPVHPKSRWDESGMKFITGAFTPCNNFEGIVKIDLDVVVARLFDMADIPSSSTGTLGNAFLRFRAVKMFPHDYILVELMHTDTWEVEKSVSGKFLLVSIEERKRHVELSQFSIYEGPSSTSKEAELLVHSILIKAKIEREGHGYRVGIGFEATESYMERRYVCY